MVHSRFQIGRLSAFSSCLLASIAGFRSGSLCVPRSIRSIMSVDSSKKRTTASHPPLFSSADETGDTDAPSSLIVSSLHNLGSSNDNSKIQLVLASQSPRRREILDMMGLAERYSATPSPLDESALQKRLATKAITPIEYTQTLAQEKANAMAASLVTGNVGGKQTLGTLVLGSDTIVDLNGKILEKPSNANEAKEMLQQLSGQWHSVHTGVSIYHVSSDSVTEMSCFVDTAEVKFAVLSEQDIEAYVETEEPMDKAGSYGIQGVGGQLVEGIQGDFFTVMGLPMHRTSIALSLSIGKIMGEYNS